MSGWLAACRAIAEERGVDGDLLQVLEAFPDRGPGEEVAPKRWEAGLLDTTAALAARTAATLDGEVDPDQAALFARRFAALAAHLVDLDATAPGAHLLRLGLHARLGEILAAPRPRALRVRALVDFYASHAALLQHRARHRGVPLPDAEALARAATWTRVAPGLEHARLTGDSDQGPLHVNLLRATGLRLRALDSRGRDLAALARDAGALAAVSGGFFLYSEPDIEAPSRRTDPVGLLLADGALLSPPAFTRAALAQDAEGILHVGRIGPAGASLRWQDGRETRIAACNDPAQLGGAAVAFNRAWAETSPDHDGPAVAIVGTTVVAAGSGPLPIPLAGVVVALPVGTVPATGVQVAWSLPPGPGGAPLRDAMAGGPMLVEGGEVAVDLGREDFAGSAPPVTFSRDETRDQNLLPRLAAGLDPEGRLLLAAVDGRNLARAPGMTLGTTARLLRALGCTRAMNLDGGSSKRMLLDDRILDLPTTELLAGGEPGTAPVRPVHTALLLCTQGL